jgi:hypothetical protein
MPLVHESFILAAATPKIIASIPVGNHPVHVSITNVNAVAIFLGDSTVSSSGNALRGIKVASESTRELWLHAGDDLYAVSAAGTGSSYDVAVLYSKVLA